MRLGAGALRGPKESTKSEHLSAFSISNLECYNAPQEVSSILNGIPGYPIEDVSSPTSTSKR